MAEGNLIPIVCVAAKAEIGVPELLDALIMCTEPPSQIERKAKNDEGQVVEVKPDPAGPLVAQVFKTRIDPFVQKLSYCRIYSGTLRKDDTITASTARKGLKLSQLLRVQANHTEPVDAAGPGEIIALAKQEDLHTGTTLGTLQLPPLEFPHADGRPGGDAEEPRRRRQTLRRAAQTGRRRPDAADWTAIRRRRNS